MRNKRKYSLLTVVFFSVILNLNAVEKEPSYIDFYKKIISYNMIYRQEKAYVHTDKPAYYVGETIWLSAYILNLKNNNLNQTEKVLYVDLIDPSGEILKKHILEVENGRAIGQIELPTHYPGGTYYLLTYTNWMRNTGSDFYFKKPLLVINNSEPNNTATGILKDSSQNAALQIEDSTEAAAPELNIRFFPEGGNLIHNIASRVAFEARNKAGRNVAVSGFIKDNNGNIESTISSVWKGKGYFFLRPEYGKEYYAEIAISDTQLLQFLLPEVKESGYTLKLESAPDSKQIRINLSRAGDDTKSAFFLLAMQNNYPVYALQDTIFQTKSYAIPTKDMSSGIVQFTIFDNYKKPQCERLFFVNKNDKLNIELLGTEFEPENRGKISLELQAKDKNQQPVEGTFSLSVTDAKRIDESVYNEPDFLTNYYFGAYLPGINYELGDILTKSNKNFLKTELIMLTNGWRRYEWEQVLKDTIEIPVYFEEPGIYVKGKLYKKNNKKKEASDGLDVTMVLSKRFNAYTQLTDEKGEFTFLLQDFTDTMKAVLQTKNKMNLKKDYYIDIETNIKSKPVDFVYMEDLQDQDTTNDYTSYFETLKQNSLKEDLRKELYKELYVDTTDIQLNELTVNGTKKTDVKGKIISRYGAPEQTLGEKQIKALNEEKSWNWGLMSIMQDAIPGLEVLVGSDTNIRFTPTDRKRHKFLIYVDGILVGVSDPKGTLTRMHGNTYEVSDLISLDATIIKSVDLIYPKDKNAGNDVILTDDFYNTITQEEDVRGMLSEQMEEFNAPVAVLSIYTQDGNGLYSRSHYKGILTLNLTGFTKTKEFYVPDYSDPNLSVETDERTTLYWNPNIKTDSEGKAKIEFYNSDKGQLFRADVVGISKDGIPADYRKTFGKETSLLTEKEQQETSDPDQIVFYDDPDEAPAAMSEKLETQAWASPAKVKVLVRKPDGEPAMFADISVKDNKWGNTSDQDGIFYLDMDLIRASDSVYISYKGEAQRLLTAAEILKGDTSVNLLAVKMRPSDEDDKNIARKAIREILSTRNRNTTYGIAAYREMINVNKELHSLFDVNLIVRVPNIRDAFVKCESKVVKGQWFKSDDYDTKALFYPKVNTNYGIQILDPAFNNSTFLKLQYFKSYDFVLEGRTNYMNRDVYKISFDQKDDLKWILSKGFMLVDTETMGIAYIEWGTSPKAYKYIVADDYLMGGTEYDDFKLLTDMNSTSYSLQDGIWELKSARQDVAFRLNRQQCAYSREQHVVEYRTKLPFNVKISQHENIHKRFILIKNPIYNPNKWRIPWFLPVNGHIKENMPYLREVLILSDPEIKTDLLDVKQ